MLTWFLEVFVCLSYTLGLFRLIFVMFMPVLACLAVLSILSVLSDFSLRRWHGFLSYSGIILYILKAKNHRFHRTFNALRIALLFAVPWFGAKNRQNLAVLIMRWFPGYCAFDDMKTWLLTNITRPFTVQKWAVYDAIHGRLTFKIGDFILQKRLFRAA